MFLSLPSRFPSFRRDRSRAARDNGEKRRVGEAIRLGQRKCGRTLVSNPTRTAAGVAVEWKCGTIRAGPSCTALFFGIFDVSMLERTCAQRGKWNCLERTLYSVVRRATNIQVLELSVNRDNVDVLSRREVRRGYVNMYTHLYEYARTHVHTNTHKRAGRKGTKGTPLLTNDQVQII